MKFVILLKENFSVINVEMREIKFEGKRWFFGQYSLEISENDFFPVNDPGFKNAGDAV